MSAFSPRFVGIISVFHCEVRIVADFYCRKPGVRATTGAAARIASWSGAEGNERKRERDAEEVTIVLYHARSKVKIECTDTITKH